MANGLVVVKEGPLVEEDENEYDYQEQEKKGNRMRTKMLVERDRRRCKDRI